VSLALSAVTAVAAVAVVAVVGCGGAEDSSLSARPPDLRARLQVLSTTSNASGNCERDLAGAVTVTPDQCPGGGASRVLVRLSTQASCSSVGTALAASLPGTLTAYQFDGAPASMKAQFCVLQGPSGDAAAVSDLLGSLCSNDSVLLATHDCSTDPSVISPTDPSSYVAPEGQVSPSGGAPSPTVPRTSHGPQTADSPGGGDPSASDAGVSDLQHSCDTCAVVAQDTLFVSLPSTMTATGTATMVVRFPDPSQPDLTILPPGGAESFTVPHIGVADTSAVVLYAPGEVPPPK
jgi:hypothetical protein